MCLGQLNNYEEFILLDEFVKRNATIRLLFNFAAKNQVARLNVTDKDFLNNREMMQLFGISERTLATWRAKSIIPYEVFQNRCYYRISDLKVLLRKNKSRIIQP